jgi:hypothetical protein
VVDAPAYEEPLVVAASRVSAVSAVGAASAIGSVEAPSATAAFGIGFEPSNGHHVAPAAAGGGVALATDPATDFGMGGIEFVSGIGERPSRDLILRLLSAVKEL